MPFRREAFIFEYYKKTYGAYFMNSKLSFAEIVDKGYEKVQNRILSNK